HIVADPDALCTSFAAVDSDIRGPVLKAFILSHLIAIENGIGFGTILRAELAALGGTNFYTDIGNKIHSAPLSAGRRNRLFGPLDVCGRPAFIDGIVPTGPH